MRIRFGAPLMPEALAEGQERAEERHAAMAERLRPDVVALGAEPAGDGR